MQQFKSLHAEEKQQGILIVTLARPKQLNALNHELVDELYRLIDRIETSRSYKVVVLKGEGKAFCSGGDLEDFKHVLLKEKNEIESFISKILYIAKKWYEMPFPTIACLHGAVVGGGASFALASDIRIASENTKIQFNFSKIGLIPDMGAHYFLPKIVGEAKALELLYFGNPINAKEAYEIGLVHQLVEDSNLEKEVFKIANQFIDTYSRSNQIIKNLIKRSSHMTLDQILNEESYYQSERFKTEEFQSFVKQFLKK